MVVLTVDSTVELKVCWWAVKKVGYLVGKLAAYLDALLAVMLVDMKAEKSVAGMVDLKV